MIDCVQSKAWTYCRSKHVGHLQLVQCPAMRFIVGYEPRFFVPTNTAKESTCMFYGNLRTPCIQTYYHDYWANHWKRQRLHWGFSHLHFWHLMALKTKYLQIYTSYHDLHNACIRASPFNIIGNQHFLNQMCRILSKSDMFFFCSLFFCECEYILSWSSQCMYTSVSI